MCHVIAETDRAREAASVLPLSLRWDRFKIKLNALELEHAELGKVLRQPVCDRSCFLRATVSRCSAPRGQAHPLAPSVYNNIADLRSDCRDWGSSLRSFQWVPPAQPMSAFRDLGRPTFTCHDFSTRSNASARWETWLAERCSSFGHLLPTAKQNTAQELCCTADFNHGRSRALPPSGPMFTFAADFWSLPQPGMSVEQLRAVEFGSD
ncbi:hypothetical protein B0H17DRAFT_1145245 [Mycena rosella]|uniref:Uncharacterized protein n=1 Tax=Mycena rosella TaxID=1033263 RepID=A0AAD7G4U9_MYCRO|nr:hypothetical protein B0H17DRAFT_1145245 [Mycena rosella]